MAVPEAFRPPLGLAGITAGGVEALASVEVAAVSAPEAALSFFDLAPPLPFGFVVVGVGAVSDFSFSFSNFSAFAAAAFAFALVP